MQITGWPQCAETCQFDLNLERQLLDSCHSNRNYECVLCAGSRSQFGNFERQLTGKPPFIFSQATVAWCPLLSLGIKKRSAPHDPKRKLKSHIWASAFGEIMSEVRFHPWHHFRGVTSFIYWKKCITASVYLSPN
jgi:hypothetical protein